MRYYRDYPDKNGQYANDRARDLFLIYIPMCILAWAIVFTSLYLIIITNGAFIIVLFALYFVMKLIVHGLIRFLDSINKRMEKKIKEME